MRIGWLVPVLLSGCTSAPAVKPNGPAVKPNGIVSNNPCIDAILAKIARTEQIAAVSAYSHDASSTSVPLAWSRQFPALGNSAEEVIAARPRLLLTGNLASNGTNAALRRAGIPMVTFGLANSIEASKQHVREIAEAIGRDEAGEKLNADIDAALPNLPHSKAAIPALIWQSDGFVAGEGTLQDDLLHRTGFHNMSRDYGLKNWDHLPLETMLIKPPKIVFMPQSASGDDGRALYARRQVLRHLKGQTRIVSFPDQLLFCGGPTIIAAAQILNTARQAESGGQ